MSAGREMFAVVARDQNRLKSAFGKASAMEASVLEQQVILQISTEQQRPVATVEIAPTRVVERGQEVL